MRVRRLLFAASILIPLVAALGTPARLAAQTTLPTDSVKEKKPPKGRANLITEEEIAYQSGALQTALDVVQRLRPAMLRVRSGSASSSSGGMSSASDNPTEIAVYFDNQKMNGVRALQDITIAQIKEIRYLSANDATTLFGTGNMAGAIQVISKR
jgi:hypothetical protein